VNFMAIDPGYTQSALVRIWGRGIDFKLKTTNDNILTLIGNMRCPDIPELDTPTVVIEMVACYGMPVGHEIFDTCVWIGRFTQRALFAGADVHLVYRKDIKLHLCHSVRANDSNVRQALIDRWGAPGTKKAPGPTYGISKDVWAALAVATYWMDTNKREEA
jgi:hypothetical protein